MSALGQSRPSRSKPNDRACPHRSRKRTYAGLPRYVREVPLPELRAQTDAALRSVRKRRSGGRPPPDCCAGTACVRKAGARTTYRVIEAGSSRGHATGGSMRRTWTIIGVADVARSCAWYQTLLGLPKSAPAHDYFGQILDADGTVLLFFRVEDFDEALPRARALVSRLEEEPHRTPSTATIEFALRDPDGYYVMVSALSA